MKKLFLSAALAATTLISANAAADGLVAEANDLPEAQRTTLQQQIATAKAQNPAIFEQVRNISGYKPEIYKKFRNPIPLTGRELRRFGKPALMPMLEALAFDMWERGDATDAEWRAVKVGMLEAVANLRDARSSAVVNAAFASQTDAKVLTAAGQAIGATCIASKGQIAVLEAALTTAKRGAAIDGLGNCRTVEAAQILAAQLDVAKNEAEAARIGRALGNLGSSWAWRAMGKKFHKEGLAARRVASEALVRSYVRFSGQAREGARIGLTMTQHPEIRAIAGLHRGPAKAAVSAKLDRLVERIEKRAKR